MYKSRQCAEILLCLVQAAAAQQELAAAANTAHAAADADGKAELRFTQARWEALNNDIAGEFLCPITQVSRGSGW